MLQQIRRVFSTVGVPVILVGLFGVILVPALEARADSGKTILETLGISTAAGVVLGAATLPFYQEPGDHTSNLGTGAAIGAAAGVGILLYGLIKGNSEDQSSLGQIPSSRLAFSSRSVSMTPGQSKIGSKNASVMMPLVSLTW